MRSALVLAFVLAACGGDDPPKPAQPTPGAPGAAAPPPAAGAGSGSAMPVANKVELLVECPPPRENSKTCDPNAVRPVQIGDKKQDNAPDLTCPIDQYCLPTTKGYLCGACPERDTIRHVFKDRDFAIEANRDPFQSYVVKAPGSGSGSAELPRDTTQKCNKPDQIRMPNYSYLDLKLVGIVRQGTQRKVLMMDPSNYGQIIRTGDCVGKEKAWVKDIGDNFVCFEAMDPSGTRVLDPHCPELHNKNIVITPLPSDAPPPPSRTPSPDATQTPPAPNTQTPAVTPRVQTPQPQPQTPPVTQPPTNLRP